MINFYALASGFLTGKYRQESDTGRSVRGDKIIETYLNPRGLRILDALDTVAAQYHATPGQVAIAWQMVRPAITAPIASATSIEQLNELVAAVHLTLNQQAITLLDAASAETE